MFSLAYTYLIPCPCRIPQASMAPYGVLAAPKPVFFIRALFPLACGRPSSCLMSIVHSLLSSRPFPRSLVVLSSSHWSRFPSLHGCSFPPASFAPSSFPLLALSLAASVLSSTPPRLSTSSTVLHFLRSLTLSFPMSPFLHCLAFTLRFFTGSRLSSGRLSLALSHSFSTLLPCV